MRCFTCGAEMRIEEVTTDHTISLSSFKRHTFKCSMCGDIEQRLVFVTQLESGRADSNPLSTSPLVLPNSVAESERDVPRSFAKRLFLMLSRMYRVISRLIHRGTLCAPALDLVVKQASQPDHESPPELRVPTPLSNSTEPATDPALSPTLSSGEKDSDADDCEKLRRRAIEVGRDSTRSSQTAKGPDEAKSEPRTKTIKLSEHEPETAGLVPGPLETGTPLPGSLQPQSKGSHRIFVQIEYDPAKTKYIAKDINTGLRLLRHDDIAWLQAMCKRMGWQVVSSGAISESNPKQVLKPQSSRIGSGYPHRNPPKQVF